MDEKEQYEARKNSFAKGLDKLVESFTKKSESDQADVLNMLPKPNSQEFGDGLIVWRWITDSVMIEAVLAVRENNSSGLPKDAYVVTMQMPESENFIWSMFDDTARIIAQALLSAWNWQNVWKLYAGDFILEEMAKQPVTMIEQPEVPEMVEPQRTYCNECGVDYVDSHDCLRESHA